MAAVMPRDISSKITSRLSSSSPGREQRCALNMTLKTKSRKPRTALEHRKSSKPIMEKRRRARINNSLSQLKTLILDALNKDTSRHSRLEKADILEMTVKHLKNLQRAHITANGFPILGKYRAGFNQCINEVTRFMCAHDSPDTEMKTRLLSHLASCISHIDLISCQPQHHLHTCPPKPGCKPPAVSQLNGPLLILPPDASKFHSGLYFVQSSDGTSGLLIPSSSGPQNDAPQSGVSPSAQVNGLDSVWRPWSF